MRTVSVNLSGGEYSTRHQDQTDREEYFQSAEVIENVLPFAEGDGPRRPGTIYVADAKDQDRYGRLLGFVTSDERELIIEAAHQVMRFYDAENFSVIETGAGAYELTTIYGETELDGIYEWQSGNVMYIAHKSGTKRMQSLIRFADNDWDINDFVFESGPFLTENLTPVTLNPSGETGNVSLSASAATFDEDMVGGLFRLFQTDFGLPYETWAAEMTIVQGDKVAYEGNVYEAAVAGTATNSPPIHESGAVSDGGMINWNYLHDLQGVVEITAYSNAQSVSGTVKERLPSSSATKFWAEGAFSDHRGWPRLGGFFEQRIFVASTDYQPDTFFMSRTAGFTARTGNFKPSRGNGEVVDDHAVTLTLADGEVNYPGWIVADEGILTGMKRGIIRIAGPSVDEPLTPAGAVARKLRGAPGANGDFRVLECDTTQVYGSRGRRRLIELKADYKTREMTRWARHVGKPRLKRGRWLEEPYRRLAILRDDGTLYMANYEADVEKNPFARVTLGGSFDGRGAYIEDIAQASDANGYDRLWLMVKRTINGVTKRTIELLAEDFDTDVHLPEEAVWLDGAVIADHYVTSGVTITVSNVDVAARTATLAASGSVFGGRTGDFIRFRKKHAPAKTSDVESDALVKIVSETGTAASVEIHEDIAAGLQNEALTDWAFCQTQITGLGHLEGEDVLVWADAVEYGPYEVSAAAVTVEVPFAYAVCGLEPPWKVRTHALFLSGPKGPSSGGDIKVKKITVGYHNAAVSPAQVRAIVDGQNQALASLWARRSTDKVGNPVPISSGKDEVKLPAPAGKDVKIEITGGGAGPFTWTSLTLEYSAD